MYRLLGNDHIQTAAYGTQRDLPEASARGMSAGKPGPCMVCKATIPSEAADVAFVRGFAVHRGCLRRGDKTEARRSPASLPATDRKAPAVSTPLAPQVIGAVYGCAVPLEVACAIVKRDRDAEYTDHEVFSLGAFDASLARGGQELWINHHGPAVRGRFSRLAVDARELRFRFELHDGPRERTLLQRVKVGDIRSCSIGYRYNPASVRYRAFDGARELNEVSLVEISLIDGGRPAWYGTWIAAE